MPHGLCCVGAWLQRGQPVTTAACAQRHG